MVKKSLFFVLVILPLSLVAASCVPQGAHDAALTSLAAKEAEVATLQEELDRMKAELAGAQTGLIEAEINLADSLSQAGLLQGQISDLEDKLADAQSQPPTLEQNTAASEGSQIGDLSPAFQLKDLDGKTVSLRDLSGRPILLNFWASWCSPCRTEMPYLQQAYDKWQGQGLVLLTIDLRDPVSAVSQFVQEGNYSMPVLLDSSGEVGAKYAVTVIPTTFFIGRSGIIEDRRIGSFRSLEAIESCLIKIMGQNEVTSPPPTGPQLSLSPPQITGLMVTINGITLPAPTTATVTRVHWEWGDGLSEDHWFPASHGYDAGGTYTVKVTSYQSDGLSTVRSVNVQVEPGPQASSPVSMISPPPGAFLDNGRIDKSDDIVWDFDWSDVPGATQYELSVKGKNAIYALLNTKTTASYFHYVSPASYIAEQNRFEWTWRVRALVNGQWTDWATGTFNVEPLNSD